MILHNLDCECYFKAVKYLLVINYNVNIMKMIFCTLFDSNYLDKGLVMYRSLCRHVDDFKLYVLAMDANCEKVLLSYNYINLVVLNINDFSLKMGLEEIRKTRKHSEFCWTCTPFLLKFILSGFKEPICTYLDADLYFYDTPFCLLSEMGEKTVQIVEHRFIDSIYGNYSKAISGTYCVQFNTFKNTNNALDLLDWWCNKCRESCSITEQRNKNVFGDQGYLENWGSMSYVSILKNLGGGVAPWNISKYKFYKNNKNENQMVLQEKKTGKIFSLVFYHFHNISYNSIHEVNIGVYEPWKAEYELVREIYIPYLLEINKTKNELKERFGIFLFPKSSTLERKNKKKKNSTFSDIIHDKLLVFKIYDYIFGKRKREKFNYLNEIKI